MNTSSKNEHVLLFWYIFRWCVLHILIFKLFLTYPKVKFALLLS